VVLLCFALAVFFGWVIPVVDYKFFNTFLGATHLPPGAIAALLTMLLVVNPLLRLLSHKAAFDRNEVLTVYLSCLFSCLVPGIGGNNYFVSFIIGGFYYSTRENHWFDALKGLPPWFTPALNPDGTYNRYVVEAWFNGLTPGHGIPWGAWVVPLLAWGLFFCAAFGMMACLSVMLRAQWGENEALAFPLLRLPLELTEGMDRAPGTLPPFFRNRLMWIGFGLVAFVQMMNGLNLYFPQVPAIPLSVDTGKMLTEAPWNQIGWVELRIFPVVTGITFLLTSEVSFSLWFFYWVLKAELIMSYYLGFPPQSLPQVVASGGPVFIGYQEVGANFAFAGLIFWSARRHLRHVFRRAMGRAAAQPEESHEALSYPVAFWGFCGGFLLMVAWGVAAGMSLPVSVLLWTSYVVIAVVLSRVVAEGGLMFVHHTWAPIGSFAGLFGAGPGTLLSAPSIVPAAFMDFAAMQDFRGSLMPSFVQSFKLARDQGIAAKPLMRLITGIVLVGMVMGYTMNVRLGYENTGTSLQSWLAKWGPQGAAFNTYHASILTQPVSLAAWTWLLIGMAFTISLVMARARFAWFPFHPLGYLMANTLPASAFWFSIFLGWLCKRLISKYGGHDLVRAVTPFFLGLALGDVSMMLFWLVVDGLTGKQGHQLMPG